MIHVSAMGYAKLAKALEPVDPEAAARYRLIASLKVVNARRRIIAEYGVHPEEFAGLPLLPPADRLP